MKFRLTDDGQSLLDRRRCFPRGQRDTREDLFPELHLGLGFRFLAVEPDGFFNCVI
jgi:hypothetical protein